MNKLATISLVTVLGVAGGGAYLTMNPDKASELTQYIPEPVTGLMNEYLPDDFKPDFLTQSNTVVESDLQVAEDQMAPQQDESVVFQDNNTQQDSQTELAQEAAEEVVENSMDEVEVSNEQDVMNVAMEEIQDALGKELARQTNEPVAAVKEDISNNPKAVKIVQKIDVINAEISKLDSENEQLKDTFQQILKKNRELAEKLKAIDEELTASN